MPTQIHSEAPGTSEKFSDRGSDDRLAVLRDVFQRQCRACETESVVSDATRRDRLNRLLALVEENEPAMIHAIDADFHGRSAHETRLAELFVVRSSILHVLRHLRNWMRPKRVSTHLQFFPSRNRLLPQPLGVVGIISPWNYPLQLSLCPALGALAAGNRVMIKPSELTPRFSDLLERLIGKHFSRDEVAVINGGPDVGEAFARLPFHHLLFTGSTAVGRKVAVAAAANLTPVTLELGGKSPAIVDTSANLDRAAIRIAFGKWMNAGQTCIAPDYLLVPKGRTPEMAESLAKAVTSLFPTLLENPDYTSIISERHLRRLRDMVDEVRTEGSPVLEINPANESFDGDTRKMPPTLVLQPDARTRLMQEEIFGPVLPIVEYDSLDEAIHWINRRDRPLALYWFGQNTAHRDRVLRETVSGGVTVNDCLWHLVQEEQPFGGVGASGMGAYHGEWGFRTFSQEKPVFYQSRWNAIWLLYPPYGKIFDALLGVLRRIV